MMAMATAKAADAKVADAEITSPQPGDVQITILSRMGDGTPDQALLDAVDAVVQADDVRQLTDTVIVAGGRGSNARKVSTCPM